MPGSTTPLGDLLVSLGYVTPDQIQEVQARNNRLGYRLGEALIGMGYITHDQLRHALDVTAEPPQIREKPPLGQVLVELEHLDQARLDAVLDTQRADPRPLGELLVESGQCTYQQVFDALSLQHKIALPEAPAKAATGVRVMVVDDSPLVCRFLADSLRELGYDVIAVQDPQHALERVDTIRPDLVVTDLEMPGMNGIELCQRLKQSSHGQLPVIILTGTDNIAQPSDGLRAGADDYVRKGTSIEELAARIDSVVRRTAATENMRRLFARYTSDAVVQEVLRAGDVVLTGEQRQVTVLFADIRNFTSIVESLAPDLVMSALNDVLGMLADAVLGCGGTLDKFLGDGVMAVFGAPVAHDDDAERALQAARLMIEATAERNRRGGGPVLDIGIGMNSGLVVAGSLGNARRTEYTCIGDTVNVAARLCAIAEPGQILIGPGAAKLLDGHKFEALSPVTLKGKAEPVPVFSVHVRT